MQADDGGAAPFTRHRDARACSIVKLDWVPGARGGAQVAVGGSVRCRCDRHITMGTIDSEAVSQQESTAARPGARANAVRRRGKPPVTRERGAGREALLEAARAEFDESGFEGTDTNRIARRAGYAPQTFYRHFTDKTAIFIET